jgi:excinuclease ABC subunit A
MQPFITIEGARLHNLKHITLSIPRNQLVVLTGLSGSGKSTLAFDTLHKEGQRQYMESMGLVTDTLSKPLVDRIAGLSPSISVDQHLTNHSPRSTVGTVTEVYTYLRVLFARAGSRPCPSCGARVPPAPAAGVEAEGLWDDDPDGEGALHAAALTSYPCPACGAPVPELGMAHFSFNKPVGACPTCTGLGVVHTGNLEKLIDPARSVRDGGVLTWDRHEIKRYCRTLATAGERYGFDFDPDQPIRDFGPVQRDLLLYGVAAPQFQRRFPDVAGLRGSSPTCCASTPSAPTTPLTGRSWSGTSSRRPAPTARATGCVRRAAPSGSPGRPSLTCLTCP